MSLALPDVELHTLQWEDLAPPCEHGDHDTDTARHGGPARWIAHWPATACGCKPMVQLLCDPWKRCVWDTPPVMQLGCKHGKYASVEEMLAVRLEPLNAKG